MLQKQLRQLRHANFDLRRIIVVMIQICLVWLLATYCFGKQRQNENANPDDYAKAGICAPAASCPFTVTCARVSTAAAALGAALTASPQSRICLNSRYPCFKLAVYTADYVKIRDYSRVNFIVAVFIQRSFFVEQAVAPECPRCRWINILRQLLCSTALASECRQNTSQQRTVAKR